MTIFKGLLYKNNFIYNFLDFLKNKGNKNLRFKILNNYIKKNSSLIDICGGGGWLKDHIDESIDYTSADASDQFGEICNKKNIKFIKLNLSKFNTIKMKFDYSVMIISLYQFKKNINNILKNLKKISKKNIIIIEEVSPLNESGNFSKIKKSIRGYLCKTSFYKKNNDLYTFNEFSKLMKRKKFRLIDKFVNNNLLIAIYEKKKSNLSS